MPRRYRDLNAYFQSIYGERVHKLTVDAGLSCPNRDGTVGTGGCIYCNERGSGTGQHRQGLSVSDQLRRVKGRVAKRFKAYKYLAYFQSFSNTYAPLPVLKQLYDDALGVEDVVGLAIGTRPDCVDESVIALLEGYAREHLVWIEYGLQSAHDDTLAAINRGHDVAAFEKAVALTRNRGIRICAHVILGLPGENRRRMMATARYIAGLGLDGVKLHLLYVIRHTALANRYAAGTYRCLEQREYVDLVCDFLELLPPHMVVQRLTSDPHPDELIAPMWCLDKKAVREDIHRHLEQRDTWQGRCATPPAGREVFGL